MITADPAFVIFGSEPEGCIDANPDRKTVTDFSAVIEIRDNLGFAAFSAVTAVKWLSGYMG